MNKTIEKRDNDLVKVREELDHFRTKDSAERNHINRLHARQVADLKAQLETTTQTHKDAQEKTSALVIAQERMAERARRNLEDAVSHHQRMLRRRALRAHHRDTGPRQNSVQFSQNTWRFSPSHLLAPGLRGHGPGEKRQVFWEKCIEFWPGPVSWARTCICSSAL